MKILIALCCIPTSILSLDFKTANALSYPISQLNTQLRTESKEGIQLAQWDQWVLPSGKLIHDMTKAVPKKTRATGSFKALKEAISTIARIARKQSQAPLSTPEIKAAEQAQKELYQAWNQLRPEIDASTVVFLRSVVELFGKNVIQALQKKHNKLSAL